MKLFMAAVGVLFKAVTLIGIIFIALALLFWDWVRGKKPVWFLVVLVFAIPGCVWTSIPTPDGRRARTLRVMPFTKLEHTRMTWDFGETNVIIDLNGYEGRVDSEAIEATGNAGSDILGASARKAVTGQ